MAKNCGSLFWRLIQSREMLRATVAVPCYQLLEDILEVVPMNGETYWTTTDKLLNIYGFWENEDVVGCRLPIPPLGQQQTLLTDCCAFPILPICGHFLINFSSKNDSKMTLLRVTELAF